MLCVGASRGHVPQGLAVYQELVQQQLLLLLHLPQLHLQQLHPHLPPPQPQQPPPPQLQRLVTRGLESYVPTLSTTCPGHAAAHTPAPVSPTRAQYAREPTLPWVTPASVLLKGAWVTVLVLISAWTMSAQPQTAPVSSLSMVFVSKGTPHHP